MYPHERSLVKRLAGRPFALIGINSDRDRSELKKIMAREGITWRSWWDGGRTEGPIALRWGVLAWPTVYVIDRRGVIRHRDVFNGELDAAVDRLLHEAEKDHRQK
jgi:hypothetical protein